MRIRINQISILVIGFITGLTSGNGHHTILSELELLTLPDDKFITIRILRDIVSLRFDETVIIF
jgi:hypothetical protein